MSVPVPARVEARASIRSIECRRWSAAGAAVALAVILAGCAPTGELARVEPLVSTEPFITLVDEPLVSTEPFLALVDEPLVSTEPFLAVPAPPPRSVDPTEPSGSSATVGSAAGGPTSAPAVAQPAPPAAPILQSGTGDPTGLEPRAALARTHDAPSGRFVVHRHAALSRSAPPLAVLTGRWDTRIDGFDVTIDISGASEMVGVVGATPLRQQLRRVGAEGFARDVDGGVWFAVAVPASGEVDGAGSPRDVLRAVGPGTPWAGPVDDHLADGTPAQRWSAAVDGPVGVALVLPASRVDRTMAALVEGRLDVWVDADGWARRTDLVIDPTSLGPAFGVPDPSLAELAEVAMADFRVSIAWSELGAPQRIERPPLGGSP